MSVELENGLENESYVRAHITYNYYGIITWCTFVPLFHRELDGVPAENGVQYAFALRQFYLSFYGSERGDCWCILQSTSEVDLADGIQSVPPEERQ
eukprot:1172818-Prorocentrum_minimum.AAC.3